MPENAEIIPFEVDQYYLDWLATHGDEVTIVVVE